MRPSDRPHLLVVAFHFPPSRASGVFRPLGMANHFVRAGWDVSVVTVTPDFFQHITGSADPSLLGAVDQRIVLERVRMPMQHLETDIRRFGWLRANFPEAHRASWELLQSALFPERYSAWIPGVLHRLGRLHRTHPVDLLLATGNPWSSFFAAWAFAKRTGVPYVIDYRDAWTLDQFGEREAHPPDSAAGRWERRILSDAARVVFVNEPQRQWHAARYPKDAERMVVVENGYDPELLGDVAFRTPAPAAGLRFGYIGTITPQLPHEPMWEGWALAAREPEMQGATALLFGHLGFFANSRNAIRARMPLDDRVGVRWEGPVPKTAIAAAYAELDVLLMLVPSSRFVTAGKVYEYMAAGRPIVAVHTPQTAASGPMRGYPLGFPVSTLDGPAVRDALVRAARRARTVTPADFAACRSHAARFTRAAQLTPFESELRELVDG